MYMYKLSVEQRVYIVFTCYATIYIAAVSYEVTVYTSTLLPMEQP